MNLQRRHKIISRFAVAMAGILIWDAAFPTISFALTGGPAQPEFSSFEPVATTNMVNEFSGDFTYNLPLITIPGANGGGYAMSLSYHSGASPEEEASWVGYGWTLNPGAINRGKRGYADDFNGEGVTQWNKTPANRTVSLGGSLGFEIYSAGDVIMTPSLNASIRYNNYKGFGLSKGVGMKFANGLVSLGYSSSDGEGSFSVKVNPAGLLSDLKHKQTKEEKAAAKASKKEPSRYKYDNVQDRKDATQNGRKNGQTSGIGALSMIGSNYGLLSYNGAVRNANSVAYKGASYNFTASVLAALTPIQAGPTFDLSGSYSWQENDPSNSLNAYGYLYSNGAGSSDMMDYYVEKSNPYDKRDKYLGIPFTNADNFVVTGEGLGGGFRLHQKQAGHYRPNAVSSHIGILNIGAEVEAGPLNIGGGADLGVGYQMLNVGTWKSITTNNDFAASSSDEAAFFRFNNDGGGEVDFGSDALQTAGLTGGGGAGNKSYDPVVSGITSQMNNGNRSGRSSYIAYHTNTEMSEDSVMNSRLYKSYTQHDDVNGLIDRSSVPDGIGELAVYNEDGARYTYGLPVYSRNELHMQYDLDGVGGGAIDDNYLAYKDISSNKSQIGEQSNTPYASSYLLTEIVSADYVDRTMDGPTDDDFGGYTRFSYDRVYGTNDKTSSTAWYKWRIPYTGLLYNKGDISTPKDDMGSVTYGEKEIYYLDTVMTKTHYAVFYTSDRNNDGYESAANATAANSRTAVGSKKLQKLDSIKVFSKGPTPLTNDKLIKTVRLEYYSAATSVSQDVPNGSGGTTGKLTLKKVWFEYDGIIPAKISPYIFNYEYSAVTYPTKYQSTMGNYGSGLTQNPNYSPFSIDAWGNYQANGSTRFANMQHWLDQTPASSFDPAAWQLKVIKLPTGGEIHVQYEQDDYSYVQDKPVEAMVSLSDTTSLFDEKINPGRYYLNTADLGIVTLADKELLRNKINDLYVIPQKKMYFKFLYNLIATAPPASLTSCASEYIKGYCSVEKTGIDANNNVYVVLRESHGDCGKFDLPRKVCMDYVKTQRAGSLNSSGNCNADAVGINYSSPKQVVLQLMNFLFQKVIPGNQELCTSIDENLSYLRIPIPTQSSAIKGKKGGGVRVKRLLLYDKGIETGDAALFGSEYVYKLEDGSSSGVATSEPSTIREESSLIEFDPKDKAKFGCKLISGRDREEHELPLGESILPGPAVGYSRVLVKNIHTGKTNTGFAIKEFYTAKDYPMTVEYTDLGSNTKKDFLPIPGGLINYFTSNLWTTQGFVFRQNSMHGQPRSESTYAGDPTDMSHAVLSTQQAFDYYQPGEQIPVMNSLNDISMSDLGKETEVTFESRKVADFSLDLALEFDADVGILLIPLPQFSLFPSFTYTESQLHTHATNKVVSYPAIQKSVTSYADGIYHLTENVAFNPHTGKPMVTRNTDGYDKLNLQLSSNHAGVYTEYKFPASQEYKDMGQKSKNERMLYTSGIKYRTSGSYHWLEFSPGCPFSECSGDLIMVRNISDNDDMGIFHTTDSIVSNKLFIVKTVAFGNPVGLSDNQTVSVEILRSGCTNQLNSDLGGFTTYADTSTTLIGSTNNIADREWLRDTLNYLKDNIINCTTHAFVTIPNNKIKPSLMVHNGSDCDTLKAMGAYGEQIAIKCTGTDIDLALFGEECYNASLGPKTGCFILDADYNLKYQSVCVGSGGCNTGTEITCLEFCPPIVDSSSRKVNVVAASAQTYDDFWAYDGVTYPRLSSTNSYENGTKGKWRVNANYVYRDSIIGANAGNQRNYKNAGVFELQVFNWLNEDQNDTTKWIKVSETTKYSPDGNALEERDILNVYSTAKFGYSGTQPYLVAKNADYRTVQFDGFEKLYSTKLEDGWAPGTIKRSSYAAHSGAWSWKMSASDSIPLDSMIANSQVLSSSSGLVMKVWVRDSMNTKTIPVKGAFFATSKYLPVTFTKVARTGEWSLLEAKVSGTAIDAVFNSGDVIIGRIKSDYSSGSIFIDDVRVQPLDAQMIAYVYDLNTQRLITTFDDQHFGLFYQYNAEGKLVRKKKETEKGMKTITETQYHTPTVAR